VIKAAAADTLLTRVAPTPEDLSRTDDAILLTEHDIFNAVTITGRYPVGIPGRVSQERGGCVEEAVTSASIVIGYY